MFPFVLVFIGTLANVIDSILFIELWTSYMTTVLGRGKAEFNECHNVLSTILNFIRKLNEEFLLRSASLLGWMSMLQLFYLLLYYIAWLILSIININGWPYSAPNLSPSFSLVVLFWIDRVRDQWMPHTS